MAALTTTSFHRIGPRRWLQAATLLVCIGSSSAAAQDATPPEDEATTESDGSHASQAPAQSNAQTGDQDAEPTTSEVFAAEVSAAETSTLRWRAEWRPYGWSEAAGTLIAASGALMLDNVGHPTSAGWVGGILFDDAIRSALAASVPSQPTMATVSDALLLTTLGVPLVLDAVVISLAVRRAPEVTLQMLGMDAQAFALTGLLTGLSKRLFRRQRPYVDGCIADPGRPWCDKYDRYQSFFSGHTSNTFTAAALSCTQHFEMKLLGGAGDAIACGGALTLAFTTGLFRILADKHWATDVLVGAAIGGLSGWLVPWLYHFGGGQKSRAGKKDALAGSLIGNGVLLPYAYQDGGGLTYLGAL